MMTKSIEDNHRHWSRWETDDNDIKIKLVKKINNSFSNLNFQIDKLLEKQEINLD